MIGSGRKPAGSRAGLFPLCLAFGLVGTGCVEIKAPKATAGFHAPTHFQLPPANAGVLARERLYVSHKVTLNAAGFQVGLVPVDNKRLDQYFVDSGAPEFAYKVQQAKEDKAEVWPPKTEMQTVAQNEAIENVKDYFPIPGLGFTASSVARLVIRDRPRAMQQKPEAEYESSALMYNLWLLKSLDLGSGMGWELPRKGLPPALAALRPQQGLNAHLDDYVWDRSLHLPLRPDEGGLFLPNDRACVLVGGHEATWNQIAAYMRSQDDAASADGLNSAVGLVRDGEWTDVGAFAAAVVGATILLAAPDHSALAWGFAGAAAGACVAGFVLRYNGELEVTAAGVQFNKQIIATLRRVLPSSAPLLFQ
jgi:hypothetical protein